MAVGIDETSRILIFPQKADKISIARSEDKSPGSVDISTQIPIGGLFLPNGGSLPF
jgi:hypothetical protein